MGEPVSFRREPRGRARAEWGTDPHGEKRSVCTAAAQAGVISSGEEAAVVIKVLPVQSSYRASDRHGVVTLYWHTSWPGSSAIIGRE